MFSKLHSHQREELLSIILLFLCGGVALLVGHKHVFAPHAMEAMKG